MRMRITKAAIVAGLFLAIATSAHAQGSITQDPGSQAPGNLTFQNLGPSAPIPGEPGIGNRTAPYDRRSNSGSSGLAPTATGRGLNSTNFGGGSNSGSASSPTGAGR